MSTKVKAEGSSGTDASKEGSASQADGKSSEGKEGSEGKGKEGDGGTGTGDAGETDEDEDSGKLDVSKLDPKVQKLIKDLRKENADSRKRAKLGEDSLQKLKKSLVEAGIIENDEESPEEKIKNLSSQNDASAFSNAVLEAALEHGVGKADLKYFRFLVQEKLESLEEGEELDDEGMAELAKQARRSTSGAGNGGSTNVNNGGSSDAPAGGGGSGDITPEQFAKMNMGEKTALYTKNKDQYEKLMRVAREKRLLV